MLRITLVYAHLNPKHTQCPIIINLCKFPRMLPLLTLRHLRNSRTRNGVASELGEDIEQNTRVSGLVEARSRHATVQLSRSTTAHNNVDALRVRLCAVRRARSVQCDDLVT
jgi:hypothetical protein